MKKKRIKISIILNILIVVMVFIASIIMFTGFKFMNGNDIVLESTKLGMFKFFTVDSNILMGIVALLFLISEVKLIKGVIKDIPKYLYILKYVGTVSVMITFSTVFLYLGHIVDGGLYSMIMNSNLFFHLLIPITSLITFCLFERSNKLEFRDSFYGLIPMGVYGVYYLSNVLIHMDGGVVSFKYDWYWFAQNGTIGIISVLLIMFIGTYILSLLVWRFNKNTK